MQRIKHLYWRAGFGLSPDAWQQRQNWEVAQAVDQLFEEAAQDKTIERAITEAGGQQMEPAMDAETRAARRKEARRQVATNTGDWIQLMADEQSSSLKHRMMLFWHGHFACRVLQPELALQQLALLEQHALGNFRDLVLAIARDPAMIRYLNNQQNRKQTPNENFARELMELFTIGRGHYTEQDVKEAARAFTGWSSDLRGQYIFRRFAHDFGRKTFMGRTGNFDGDEIIDIILERRETAQFITRKLYRHFVNEKVDETRVQQLADQFYRSNYDIGGLMRTIFSSEWFYEPRNMGNQIKSPMVLLAGMLRALPTRFQDPLALVILQKALGQMIFNPPNVAGWPAGRNWIDNSTLMLRLNLPIMLLEASDAAIRPKDSLESKTRGRRLEKVKAEVDLSGVRDLLSIKTLEDPLLQLTDYLLIRPVGVPAFLEQEIARQTDEKRNLLIAVAGIMSMPEYQLC
ncbi:MAG: DUF1800 domain-containing protein [Saprospiraceae bacterium]|nr:DUF1800 domain-containing protein [Lewinella sp.]